VPKEAEVGCKSLRLCFPVFTSAKPDWTDVLAPESVKNCRIRNHKTSRGLDKQYVLCCIVPATLSKRSALGATQCKNLVDTGLWNKLTVIMYKL